MKTVTLSLRALIAIGVIIALLVGGVVGWSVQIVEKHKRELAAVDFSRDHFIQKSNEYGKKLEEHTDLIHRQRTRIEELTAQQGQIQTKIEVREKTVLVEVEKVTSPSLTAVQVADKAKTTLSLKHPDKMVVAGDLIAFDKTDVQHIIATKIQRDWLREDKADLQELMAAEKKKVAALSFSLAEEQKLRKQSEALTKDCTDLADDYRKVAKSSKKAKVVKGLGTLVVVAGAFLAGRGSK